MVICSELQNLIFDRKEVNPGALRATCGGPSAWSEARRSSSFPTESSHANGQTDLISD
jgi:hypothetical protein